MPAQSPPVRRGETSGTSDVELNGVSRISLERSFVVFVSTVLNNSSVVSHSSGEEVVFDVQTNGHRFLLVHMPVISRPTPDLSPREIEIVRMVALGHPNKIIADVLGISCWTVGTYLRRIFAKLGVGSRAAMIARMAHVNSAHDLPEDMNDRHR
jgi:DNA-binding CsgD family transcriptional regulator